MRRLKFTLIEVIDRAFEVLGGMPFGYKWGIELMAGDRMPHLKVWMESRCTDNPTAEYYILCEELEYDKVLLFLHTIDLHVQEVTRMELINSKFNEEQQPEEYDPEDCPF